MILITDKALSHELFLEGKSSLKIELPRRNVRNIFASILLIAVTGFSQASASGNAKMAPAIAVSNLEALGLSSSDALVITDQLRSEFMKTQAFQVIERSQMEEILKEQGFQQSGCTNDECAVKIGQVLGAQYIAVGSLGSAGSYTMLTCRIIDVGTAKIVANYTFKNRGGVDAMVENGVTNMTGELIHEFKTSIGDTTATKTATAPEKKHHGGVVAGVIIGGVAVAGGAVAAVLILGGKKSGSSNNTDDATLKLNLQ